MGVDQNKRAWERYNRRSTANQSRTHRWQSRRDFVLSNVICTENEIDISIYTEIYTSHNLEEIGKRHGMAMGQWLHLGVPQSPHNRGSIAAQSITNMETRSTKRLTLHWEVIWLSIKKETVIDRAKPSTQDCSILQIWTAILQRMSFSHIHNRWLHQSHTNRRSIAMSVLQSRMSRYEGRFIILRCAFASGAHILGMIIRSF